MKTYIERHIRRSEIFQLILLQYLYARPESWRLIFQGGTAIRWCHNGGRFSEDLDFVVGDVRAERALLTLTYSKGPISPRQTRPSDARIHKGKPTFF